MPSARNMRSSRASMDDYRGINSDGDRFGSQEGSAAIDIPGTTGDESWSIGVYNERVHMRQSLNAMEQRMSLSRSRGRPGSSVPNRVLQSQSDNTSNGSFHSVAPPARSRMVTMENSWSTTSPATPAPSNHYPVDASYQRGEYPAGAGYDSRGSTSFRPGTLTSAANVGRGEFTPQSEETSRQTVATAFPDGRRHLVTADESRPPAAARRDVSADYHVVGQYHANYPGGTYYDSIAEAAGPRRRGYQMEYWEASGMDFSPRYSEERGEGRGEEEDDDDEEDNDGDDGVGRVLGDEEALPFILELEGDEPC